jgi:mRNA interferase MazF
VVRATRDRTPAGRGPVARCGHPAPCTTTIRGLASEVVLEPGDDPVPRETAVNLDSIESVSVGLLVERLGRLSDTRMREVCAALAVATDCR